MSAPMKRVVGWFGKEEWASVYQELFSDDVHLQKHALDRITVWKCRLSHRLSSGIECTWHLMTAQLQDRVSSADTCEQDQQLRLTYAMALVRFVNLITEKEQKKVYARPIHLLAEELGLPEWLVDMRHEATHASLPSLLMLRCGAQTAIAWIKREYWDAQAADDWSGDDSPTTPLAASPITTDQWEQRLSDGLVNYMQEKFHVMNGGHRTENKTTGQLKQELERIVSKHKELCVGVFVQDGCLVPSREQLEVMGIDIPALEESENLDFPSLLVDLWDPILRLLHNKGHLPLLLYTLAGELSGDGSLRDRLLVGWLTNLVTANCQSGDGQMFPHRCLVDGRRLVQICLQHPNRYTVQLLQCLHNTIDTGIASTQFELLVQLSSTMTGTCNRETETNDDNGHVTDPHCNHGNIPHSPQRIEKHGKDDSEVFTVESLLTQGDTLGQGKSQEPSVTWKLCTDYVWEDYPLGLCPGEPLTYRSLELSSASQSVPHSQKNSLHKKRVEDSRTILETEVETDERFESLETECSGGLPIQIFQLDSAKTPVLL